MGLVIDMIYSFREQFDQVLVFFIIPLHNLDTILIVKEDRRRENGIEHIWDFFAKSFEIIFTIPSDF